MVVNTRDVSSYKLFFTASLYFLEEVFDLFIGEHFINEAVRKS